MTLPRQTVLLRVDYGEPDWREPAPGEPADARAMAGYAELTHDGATMRVEFDGRHEIEMKPQGARIIAEALLAFADMMEGTHV
jgi:hypothetical protein